MVLDHSFYQREDVCEVARDLLGCVLCTHIEGITSRAMIVETEAYSERERACHAYGGRRTQRTETLFMNGGVAYVYLVYGMYELFNVVTNREGVGEAVLIRAAQPLEPIEPMNERRGNPGRKLDISSGPGKLSIALGISREHNMSDLTGPPVWIEPGKPDAGSVVAGPRIGVDYAGEDALLPWRFYLGNNPWVSRPNTGGNTALRGS